MDISNCFLQIIGKILIDSLIVLESDLKEVQLWEDQQSLWEDCKQHLAHLFTPPLKFSSSRLTNKKILESNFKQLSDLAPSFTIECLASSHMAESFLFHLPPSPAQLHSEGGGHPCQWSLLGLEFGSFLLTRALVWRGPFPPADSSLMNQWKEEARQLISSLIWI